MREQLKVLGVELGADATYFSKYYAPDFCPGINQFAVQMNEASRVELGGYPFVDVYANMALKGVRFFLMMTNVLNGTGNHMKFLTPHYPTNGSVIHFCVSWPFFNYAVHQEGSTQDDGTNAHTYIKLKTSLCPKAHDEGVLSR